MDRFIDALVRFMSLKPLQEDDPALFVFVGACATMGLLGILGDWAHYLVRGSSLMNLSHGFRKTPVTAFGWVLGAAIGGFFGQVLNILQITILAALTAGVGWPFILTKAIEQAKNESESKPEVVQA